MNALLMPAPENSDYQTHFNNTKIAWDYCRHLDISNFNLMVQNKIKILPNFSFLSGAPESEGRNDGLIYAILKGVKGVKDQPDLVDNAKSMLKHLLKMCQQQLETPSCKGHTPLQYAARYCPDTIVQILYQTPWCNVDGKKDTPILDYFMKSTIRTFEEKLDLYYKLAYTRSKDVPVNKESITHILTHALKECAKPEITDKRTLKDKLKLAVHIIGKLCYFRKLSDDPITDAFAELKKNSTTNDTLKVVTSKFLDKKSPTQDDLTKILECAECDCLIAKRVTGEARNRKRKVYGELETYKISTRRLDEYYLDGPITDNSEKDLAAFLDAVDSTPVPVKLDNAGNPMLDASGNPVPDLDLHLMIVQETIAGPGQARTEALVEDYLLDKEKLDNESAAAIKEINIQYNTHVKHVTAEVATRAARNRS